MSEAAEESVLQPLELPIRPGDLVLQSEFGGVILAKDVSANGDRLRVLGITSGVEIYLDPLELERIAVAGHDAIALLVSPEPLSGPALVAAAAGRNGAAVGAGDTSAGATPDATPDGNA